MLTYWIENASISTITFTNADLRVNWGLITFDEEDCFLRKHKIFKRHVYFICAGIDLILNVGWALTIST